jgi:hypothetical protein
MAGHTSENGSWVFWRKIPAGCSFQSSLSPVVVLCLLCPSSAEGGEEEGRWGGAAARRQLAAARREEESSDVARRKHEGKSTNPGASPNALSLSRIPAQEAGTQTDGRFRGGPRAGQEINQGDFHTALAC